ncbi:hypothetical protein HB943_14650 [Listeria weihenstephanensis]|uniref:Uncharacterized protein n=1 Tax=Listeria weihenstephanensis TaxID=1006155 RepID=A0A841Z9I2_9LIST|nr:hypothetical protein [Listeria weihenstephanensis]MBC1501838.1 hypothetical protein [Listeria weihenstephanensis]
MTDIIIEIYIRMMKVVVKKNIPKISFTLNLELKNLIWGVFNMDKYAYFKKRGVSDNYINMVVNVVIFSI